MKNMISVILLIIILSSAIFGNSVLNSIAKEPEEPKAYRYYKSIEIRQGDNLWNIAEQYIQNSSLTTEEYVRELKNMNNLHDDTIHIGRYLTIVYYTLDKR